MGTQCFQSYSTPVILPLHAVPPSPTNIVWDQSHTNNASLTSTFISLEWNSNTYLASDSNFIIEIILLDFLGEILYYTTTNTTIQVPVVYNQEYDIKILANNCIGNSSSANLSLLISKQIKY